MLIRPVSEADYPRLLAIANLTSIRPVTLEDFTSNLAHSARRGPMTALALEQEGEILGYGTLTRGPFLPPNAYYVGVRVDPAASNRGIGTALLSALEAEAAAWGATMLEAGVRDHRPDWRAFAERRGYVLKEHFFNSELDLATFDPEPFRPQLARAEAAGYQFRTMAEMPGEAAERELYQIDMDCSMDEPDKGPDWQPIDYQEWRRDLLAPTQYDPNAVFVALQDGQWAGISGCLFPPGREAAWVFFTGVRRQHRGQGLAQALKLLACEYVKAHRPDYRKIATGNHARNQPMLAVNQKFGFVPMPGSYILRKQLEAK